MKPFDGVIRLPCPTMIPDRMGIIGKTQGVIESKRPAPKNKRLFKKIPPPMSLRVKASCSEIITSEATCALTPVAALPDCPDAIASNSGSTSVVVFFMGG